MNSALETKNRPESWRKRQSHSKMAEVQQKDFTWLYVLSYAFTLLFIPSPKPILNAMRLFLA